MSATKPLDAKAQSAQLNTKANVAGPAGDAVTAGARDPNQADRKERKPFGEFDNDFKTAPGFVSTKSFNLNNCLRDLLPDKRPVSLKLSRPAVLGAHTVVGTDDPEAKEHFLIVVDTSRMVDSTTNPIATKTSYLQIKEHVRDVCWMRNGKVLVAVGDGVVQLYSVDRAGATFNLNCIVDGQTDPIHTDSVREIAASPFKDTDAVSCGFDKSVCYLDISQPTRLVRRYQLNEVVGSVRWSAFKGASTVTATTDDGKFHKFDFRQSGTAAALSFNTSKPDMFAHENYEDNYVVLGYADGELRNYDLRQTAKPLSVTVDPYVDCVGNIHYRHAADPNDNSFVVTGMTDFSVWSAREGQPQKVWSHQISAKDSCKNDTNFTTTASYLSDTDVLVATSNGFLEVFVQRFQSDLPL